MEKSASLSSAEYKKAIFDFGDSNSDTGWLAASFIRPNFLVERLTFTCQKGDTLMKADCR
ncbi:hypothetical protein NC651_005648 [Populus alba x Populus x berolinensis]|nr:hypothetical protein NC651_005648 [Populus alba x Populus x berolinensis]